MFTTKLRIAALLVLTILVLSAARFFIPCGAYGEAAPAPAAPKVPKEMLEKRLTEAKTVWAENWQRVGTRNGQPGDLFGWSERLLDAELALADKKEDRIKALQAHIDRTREVERIAIANANRGIGRQADAHAATYERLNGEIRYFEAAGKVPPPPEKKK